VDFHALRVAYTIHVIESGADIKTAQTLARHCSPQLTLSIYAQGAARAAARDGINHREPAAANVER